MLWSSTLSNLPTAGRKTFWIQKPVIYPSKSSSVRGRRQSFSFVAVNGTSYPSTKPVNSSWFPHPHKRNLQTCAKKSQTNMSEVEAYMACGIYIVYNCKSPEHHGPFSPQCSGSFEHQSAISVSMISMSWQWSASFHTDPIFFAKTWDSLSIPLQEAVAPLFK